MERFVACISSCVASSDAILFIPVALIRWINLFEANAVGVVRVLLVCIQIIE